MTFTPNPNYVAPEITIPEMLRRTVRQFHDKVALKHKVKNDYVPLLYGELAVRVRNVALGLYELGVRQGTRVCLLSENRPEWAIVDLALATLGAVNVPLYATLPPPQVEYIAADSESEVLIASNDKQLAKVLEVWEHLPQLRHVLVLDPPANLDERVRTFTSIEELGARQQDADARCRELEAAVRPSDLVTIIYTSGTTGEPKGAMLTHDNFMSNALSVAAVLPIFPEDVFLSFLPLSHVFERMAGHYLPLAVGCTVVYSESIFTVQSNMTEVCPTLMASVPRLYEAIHGRIKDTIAKAPPNKKRLAEWAIATGWRYHGKRIRGEQPGLLASLLYPLADRLVLKAIRQRVTGGQMRYFISGGAPLPVDTAEFITALGLHVLEGYGLTETSPVICVNRPERTKLGTVGSPLPGVEVRIASDGEILSRGRHIMLGYYKKAEDTAQAIDPDGWFHTGDIGVIDEEGYLKITDRKKDIIVLANGKNVAPQPIEAKVKSSPYIANVVLFGDRQPQIVALVVPSFEHLRAWAKERGLTQRSPEELVALPEVKKLIRKEIDQYTQSLADFEKVRRFTLLTHDFSQETGELTPTLKIKRPVVREKYADEIRALFGN